MPLPLQRSIADLEQLHVERGAYELGRVAWLSRALVSPIGQLGLVDLRLLLLHERGLPWIIPLALDRLEADPFLVAGDSAGDLLVAVLLVDDAVWIAHPDLAERLRRVLALARERVATFDPAHRERLREELDAADEMFDR
jgi:hypothetical protein